MIACIMPDDQTPQMADSTAANCGNEATEQRGGEAEESATEPSRIGGSGILQDRYQTRSDIRLAERAARHWDIPADAFRELPQRLYETALAAERPEVLINATRALTAMHGQNVEASRPSPVNQRVNVTNNFLGISAEDQATLAAAGRIMQRKAIAADE